MLAVNVIGESSHTVRRLFSWYSDWYCLKRAVAWILQIKTALRVASSRRQNLLGHKQSEKAKQPLHLQDLQDAEDAIFRFCQETSFADEMCSLKRGEAVKTNSHLVKLSPIFQNEMNRVGG